jgi:hypothetical protein
MEHFKSYAYFGSVAKFENQTRPLLKFVQDIDPNTYYLQYLLNNCN